MEQHCCQRIRPSAAKARRCDKTSCMHTRFALITASAVLVTGLGLAAASAQQKAAKPSLVVYKSPT